MPVQYNPMASPQSTRFRQIPTQYSISQQPQYLVSSYALSGQQPAYTQRYNPEMEMKVQEEDTPS